MMDDETFSKFVTYDEGNDSEKENETQRQQNTTQNQFDMIESFMKINNEELIDKEISGQLWDGLAANLNKIGPPQHTVVEWKKIWSSHKYYKNRKRLSIGSLRSDKSDKASRLDQSPQVNVGIEEVPVGAQETIEIGPTELEFLNRLDVIIMNQNTMIANQNAIISNQDVLLKELKSLVEVIAKKA